MVDPSHAAGQALAGAAAGPRGDGRRRGRAHRRGPPAPRRGALRRRPVARPGQFRDLMAAPCRPRAGPATPRRPRPRAPRSASARAQALSADAASEPTRAVAASAPLRACAASSGCPATSRSATGRSSSPPWPRASSRIAGAGDGRTSRATAALRGGARRAVERRGRRPTGRRLPDRLAGPRRPPRAGRHPRLRELRHHAPAAGRDPRRPRRSSPSSTATPRCAAGRWAASPRRCAAMGATSAAGRAPRSRRSRSRAARR